MTWEDVEHLSHGELMSLLIGFVWKNGGLGTITVAELDSLPDKFIAAFSRDPVNGAIHLSVSATEESLN